MLIGQQPLGFWILYAYCTCMDWHVTSYPMCMDASQPSSTLKPMLLQFHPFEMSFRKNTKELKDEALSNSNNNKQTKKLDRGAHCAKEHAPQSPSQSFADHLLEDRTPLLSPCGHSLVATHLHNLEKLVLIAFIQGGCLGEGFDG